MAYARTDAAYLDDTVFDEDPATRTGGASDGPREAGTSPAGAHHLRCTADVRAGQFLRALAASAGDARLCVGLVRWAPMRVSLGPDRGAQSPPRMGRLVPGAAAVCRLEAQVNARCSGEPL
jgi:hypothetical protein